MEVVEGRTRSELEDALAYIPGRENVRAVALDLCDPFKSFARGFFPNATLVADKFHVLRLLFPAINRYRKAIAGDRRSLPVRRLLLRNGRDLDPRLRWALRTWLAAYPELRELYDAKESLAGIYRVRSYVQAARILTAVTDDFARSRLPEILTLRRTLLRWRREILAYFQTRLTNGMTEGFNLKAKLVKRRLRLQSRSERRSPRAPKERFRAQRGGRAAARGSSRGEAQRSEAPPSNETGCAGRI